MQWDTASTGRPIRWLMKWRSVATDVVARWKGYQRMLCQCADQGHLLPACYLSQILDDTTQGYFVCILRHSDDFTESVPGLFLEIITSTLNRRLGLL